MPKVTTGPRKCYVCQKTYTGNKYGKFGRGGWRTCSPWCKYYDLARMI